MYMFWIDARPLTVRRLRNEPSHYIKDHTVALPDVRLHNRPVQLSVALALALSLALALP